MPEGSAPAIAQLDQVLPRNVSGLSFNPPEFVDSPASKVRVYSVSSPGHVAQHLGVLGDRMLDASQALAALRFYDLALRVGPESGLQTKRAEALFCLGRIEEAQRELLQFLRKEPRDAEALFWMGRISLHQEQYEDASRYFRQASGSLAEGRELRQVCELYSRFAQIYKDRDQLHLRNLSPSDYVVEIQQLQTRVHGLQEEVEGSAHALLQGMAVHLEGLENLFASWLRELQARPQAS